MRYKILKHRKNGAIMVIGIFFFGVDTAHTGAFIITRIITITGVSYR